VTAVLVPAYLGDAGLGQYAIVTGIAWVAGTVATFGVPEYLTRRIAMEPGRAASVGSAALLLLACIALVTAGVVWLGAAVLRPSLVQDHLLLIALIGMVVATLQGVLTALLIGQSRVARFAWLNAAGVLISAGGGIAVLFLGGGVAGLLITGVAVSALVLAIGWYGSGFGLQWEGLTRGLLLQMARGGLPFVGWNLTLRVRNDTDLILIGFLLREQVAGWLSAGYHIVYISLFIPTLITTPLLPALSRHVSEPAVFRKTVHRCVVVALTLTVPMSAMLIVLAPVIPGLLHWAPEFEHSVPVIVLLAFEQPIMAIDMVLGTSLIALHRERVWLRVGIAAAIFNPVANVVLLPLADQWLQNGAVGAAIAEGITELLMLVGAIILIPRGVLDRETLSVAARLGIAGACLYVTAMVVLPISLPFAVVTGALAFVGVGAVLGVLRAGDLMMLRQVALDSLARRPIR
jgi:O-antigen/teichoic acid export membrane protein